jgi:hypothetical protein
MTLLQRYTCNATLIGLCLGAASGAYAQGVNSINSAIINTRVWSDIPGAILTTADSYPSAISFNEQNVSTTNSAYANRDTWQFSNNGGISAYQFQNNDYFYASMNLTLTANSLTPRREAGFLFDTAGGQGQFIVNTDSHEIVAFGGPLPFYAFPSTFNSGETITLGMNYFLDSVTGLRSIIYSANGVNSPILPFTDAEQGIINGSTLAGYFQIVNDPLNPLNSGSAKFQNINISVPEPSTFALLSMGIVTLGAVVSRRRRL